MNRFSRCAFLSSTVSAAAAGLIMPGTATAANAKIRHRRIATNGIHLHVAEAGSGPLVVMLHGFPELWYSWRHQLPALAGAGYRAIAPDLRGCGQSDAPAATREYSMRELTADVIGLIDAYGSEQAILIGHDWGASIAWACAELYPQRVAGLIALSVPYHPRPSMPPVEMIEKFAAGHFSFVQYFQKPGVAETELENDTEDALRRFFYSFSGDAPSGTIEYLFTGKPASAGVLDGMPEPRVLPAWLTASDLAYYAREYKRTGFRGALSIYRNMDEDWRTLPRIGATGTKAPVLFIGGKRDSAVMFGTFDPMIRATPSLHKIEFFPGCGHWTQQERPAEVNAAVLQLLRNSGLA